MNSDQAGCKDLEKLQGWEIDQINWNLTHKWEINEQNVEAQKKIYNTIRFMPSKSSAAIKSVVPSVNKMWYHRIGVSKFKIFPSNQP